MDPGFPRHWPYFCNFVELSECLSFASGGDQRQARTVPELVLKAGTGWDWVEPWLVAGQVHSIGFPGTALVTPFETRPRAG